MDNAETRLGEVEDSSGGGWGSRKRTKKIDEQVGA